MLMELAGSSGLAFSKGFLAPPALHLPVHPPPRPWAASSKFMAGALKTQEVGLKMEKF